MKIEQVKIIFPDLLKAESMFNILWSTKKVALDFLFKAKKIGLLD